MAFTADELELVNMSLAAIGATRIASIADTTSVNAVQCLLHYEQTRDALLRSFLWNFAKKRSALPMIYTLTVDTVPSPDAWVAGDTITGTSSGETATVLTVLSDTTYEIIDQSGDFEDGEELSNGTDAITCAAGYPTVEATAPDFEWEYQFVLPSDYLRMDSNYSESDFDDPNERWQLEGTRLLTNDSEANIRYIRKVTDPTEFDSLFVECLILQLAMKLIPALAGTMSAARRQEVKDDLRLAMSKARTVHRQETNTSGQSNWNNARFYADNSTE